MARGTGTYPSVWRDTGCRSPFILWSDGIYWNDGHDPDYPSGRDEELKAAVLARLDGARFSTPEEIADGVGIVPWAAARIAEMLSRTGEAEARLFGLERRYRRPETDVRWQGHHAPLAPDPHSRRTPINSAAAPSFYPAKSRNLGRLLPHATRVGPMMLPSKDEARRDAARSARILVADQNARRAVTQADLSKVSDESEADSAWWKRPDPHPLQTFAHVSE